MRFGRPMLKPFAIRFPTLERLFSNMVFGTFFEGPQGATMPCNATPLSHFLDLLDDFGNNCALHLNDCEADFDTRYTKDDTKLFEQNNNDYV